MIDTMIAMLRWAGQLGYEPRRWVVGHRTMRRLQWEKRFTGMGSPVLGLGGPILAILGLPAEVDADCPEGFGLVVRPTWVRPA